MKPTGLAAWENGPTRIVLVWKAPAATGGEITGYKIEHSEDGNDWEDLVANTMSTDTTYTDTSVEAGTVRHYRVSAVNSAGTSETPAEADEARAVTGTEALPPPTSLLAQMSEQRVITLSWTIAGSGNGYLVERSEDGRTGWDSTPDMTITSLSTDTFRDDDTELELSTTYYYRVSTTATSGDSVRSRPSRVANGRTGPVEVPGAPTDLTLDEKGPSRIDLTWIAPVNTGGADIDGYRIEYSDDDDDSPAANTWRRLVANTMSDDPEYKDHGSTAELDEGEQRHYRVSAINSAGTGPASESMRSDETPENPTEKPGAPTGLTATATGPKEIELSWTAPEDTSGAEITGYMIEYATLGTGTGVGDPAFANWADLEDDTGDDDTTFTDDGSVGTGVDALAAETTRRYRVTALNGSNTGDDNNSNLASATTDEATVPGMPTGLTLTPVAPTGSQHQINLSWTAPVNTGGADLAGYRIERSENGSSWEDLVKDTEEISDLTHMDETVPKANTRWHYRVSAINSEGPGMPSAAATAFSFPAVAPVKPTGLAAWENGPTRIVLVWKAPAATGGEITGYKIEHSEDGNDWEDLVANTMSTDTTYTDTSVEAGTVRHYRVSAVNSAGTSETPAEADEARAVTGTEAPTLTIDGPTTASRAENGRDTMATYTASGPGSEMVTWSLSGDDRNSLTIGGGMLMFRATPDYENPSDMDEDNTYMVTVMAAAGGEMGMMDVTVTVTNEKEGGMVTLSPMSPLVGDVVMATVTDEDGMVTVETWEWARTMDMADGWNVITGADMATYTATSDDDGHYLQATATYTDGYGADSAMGTTENTVTANNPPMFAADTDTRSVAENTAAGMNIGEPVMATDPNEGDTLTYALSGDDAASFDIVETSGQLMTNAALDYETKTEYMVTVTATDGDSASDSIMVTIMVTGVNEAPEFATETDTRSVAENTAAGMNIGEPVMATDPDEGDTLTYALSGDDAASFDIVETSGQLMTNAALDYETKTEYMVTVTATDGDSASDSIMVTIMVTDVELAAEYDANGNDMVDKEEVIAAINDYLFEETLSKAEVIELINLYLFDS